MPSNNGISKIPTTSFKPVTSTANSNGQTGSKFSGNGLFKSSIYGNEGTSLSSSSNNYQKPSFLGDKSALNHSGGKTTNTSGG